MHSEKTKINYLFERPGLVVTQENFHKGYVSTLSVTVHTAGRNEEHADEEILQNNSL